jgi:triosephosphate isomerase
MRKFILAANWKMNLTAAEAQDWLNHFTSINPNKNHVEFLLYATSVLLSDLTKSQAIHIGAQNVHPSDSGAYTGEVSIPQLKSIGVQSVLIGHSERRNEFHESIDFIKEKVDASCKHAFPFILCCGEDLKRRENGTHLSFIRTQLTSGLSGMGIDHVPLLTIAYEPIWAIGTGQTATTAEITEVHTFIRSVVLEFFGESGASIPILYGGSVNSSNAASIFACPEVNGGLIGGASLNASNFLQLASTL